MMYLFYLFIIFHLEIANITLWTDAEISLCLYISQKHFSSLSL